MVVLQAIQTALSSLRRNPILVGIVAVIGLFQLPSLVAQSTNPLVGGLISLGASGILLVVTPFFVGGLIAMATEAIDGRTRFGTFVAAGKRNYVSILLVYLGVFAVNLVLGFVIVFASIATAAFGFGWTEPSTVGIVIFAALGLFGILAYLGVFFFIQFYAHAIVLDGMTAIEGVKKSISTVRQNLLTVFGYNLITGAGGIGLGVLASVVSLLATPMPAGQAETTAATVLTEFASVGLAGSIALTLVVVVVSAFVGGFFAIFSTAVYRSIRPAF